MMSDAPVIHVEDAELAERIIDFAARGTSLRVEVSGKTYALHVKQEGVPARTVPSPDYDPEKVAEALDKYAGAWSDLDVEEMKVNLYRAREEGTRPPDRP